MKNTQQIHSFFYDSRNCRRWLKIGLVNCAYLTDFGPKKCIAMSILLTRQLVDSRKLRRPCFGAHSFVVEKHDYCVLYSRSNFKIRGLFFVGLKFLVRLYNDQGLTQDGKEYANKLKKLEKSLSQREQVLKLINESVIYACFMWRWEIRGVVYLSRIVLRYRVYQYRKHLSRFTRLTL